MRGKPWTDVGVPAAIALLGTVETVGLAPPGMWAALGLLWFTCGVLVVRRRWPMTAGTVAGLTIILTPYAGPALEDLSTPALVLALATFTLSRHVADLRGLVPFSVILVALALTSGLTKIEPDITDIVFVAVLLTPPFVFGRVLRLLDDRNRLLAEHAALVTARQEAAQREALAAERARMAREVHDVVAHSVSVMTIQAAAAEDMVRTRPDEAVAALRIVQETGRDALAEAGRLLRVLRSDAGVDVQSVADLDALVAEFRRAGLDIALTVDGALDDLPAGVSVSTYRVLREVLTNALKHAPDRRLDLRLIRDDGRLVVSAENRVGAEQVTPGGLGLVGMSERVAIHGGRLTHGRDGDLFRLAASIPLRHRDPGGGCRRPGSGPQRAPHGSGGAWLRRRR
jgi:signal transduction histidine kinase